MGIYDLDTGLLQGIPDHTEFEDFRVLKQVFSQVSPAHVIVSSSSSQKLTHFLTGVGAKKQNEVDIGVRLGVSKRVEDGRRLPALWAGHP
jgi:hypothetical protein